jgi:hypothetical protein
MTLRLAGSTSGYTEIDAPAVAGNNSIALPAGNGSAYQVVRNGATAGSWELADKIVSGTSQATTSGTSIDFTGIPSWVKRVTVMLNGVSTNGTSLIQVQLGAGSVTTSGYATQSAYISGAATANAGYTSGFVVINSVLAAATYSGTAIFNLLGSNAWCGNSTVAFASAGTALFSSGGSITLSGTLDRVRITTVNGTDTFDAGSINILYE